MNRLLASLLRNIVRRGSLTVLTAKGEKHTFGDGTGTPVTVRFADAAAQRALLFDPELRLGELYMDGRFAMAEGSIYDFLELVIGNLHGRPYPLTARMMFRIRTWLRGLSQLNLEGRAKRNVAHHYDLDRHLYDLFLDRDRQYSCAYFEHSGQSLEDAQLAKKRHVTAKLAIDPGHRVLDIGCGWGGLGLYLAEIVGADVIGITLSEEQYAMARDRAANKGLQDKVAFRLEDYRETQGSFDRIVSVGMFEHVGVGFYETYFRHCARLLSEDGVMLLHTIGRTTGPGATSPWIAKYIFPGGYIPALEEIIPVAERAGLMVTDVEVLRIHYAETLKAWRARFVARKDEAVALYDERFVRMWEFYLACCEASFRCGDDVVYQIQLSKKVDTLPISRSYIAEREKQLRKRERAPMRMAAE